METALPDESAKRPPKELNPLVAVASAQEVLDAQKKAEEQASKATETDPRQQLTELEKYLSDIFEDARSYKESETEIQATMVDSLLRKNSKYDETKLSQIKAAGGSEAYLGVTGVKCRAFEAFIHDIYMNAKKKRTWTLKPTPIVTIPDKAKARIKEQVMAAVEAAKASDTVEIGPEEAFKMASDMRVDIIRREYELGLKRAENMSRLVHDQMIEGRWVKALSEAVMDLSTMKAMIIKGPTLRSRKVKVGWDGEKVRFGQKEVQTFERVSPLDLYPSRYTVDPNDGTPLCEKVTIERNSLVANRHKDGYIAKNIENIAIYGGASVPQRSTHAADRERAENKDNLEASPTKNKKIIGSTLKGIEHWCSVRGKDLIDMGIILDGEKKAIDMLLDYEINAITIDDKLVFIEFNQDPLGRRPYSIAGFAKEIGGFWYRGIPELLKDPQDIINAAVRAMVNNLGWSSGPQVIIPDVNRLAPGEDITSIYVGKIWQGINGGGSNGSNKLIDFYQPDSRSAELIGIINNFLQIADQLIEMPAYSYGGDNVAGAGRTSGGLSMLMSASSRGTKRVILDVDRNVFQNTVEQLVDFNLENSDDESIKGDMNFYSEGVISIMMKEQLSDKRMAMLQATSNEFDMKILGLEGRAKILTMAMEALESDYDDILPTEEKIDALIKQEEIIQRQNIQQNQMDIEKEQALIERENEVKVMEAQIAMEKLQVEKRAQDLEFKAKERELDIRAEKQIGDRMIKQQEMADKSGEGGENATAK